MVTPKLEQWHAQLLELDRALEEHRWNDLLQGSRALQQEWLDLFQNHNPVSHSGWRMTTRLIGSKMKRLGEIIAKNTIDCKWKNGEPSLFMSSKLTLVKMAHQVCLAYYHPQVCNELLMRDLDPAQMLPQTGVEQ